MAETNTVTMPTVIPMIAYEDGPAALEWLARAFGFRERMRLASDDGRITHAEMEVGSGLIMLATPTPEYRSPRRHREECEQARKWRESAMQNDGQNARSQGAARRGRKPATGP